MRANRMYRLFTMAALLCGLQGSWAAAESPEYSLGYSTFHLRPSSGLNQKLQGFVVGGRYSLDPTWSLEAALNRQTGTEAGSVDLRQTGLMAGPRYSHTFFKGFQAYAHVLAGFQQLLAREGSVSDKKNTLALAPGVGVEYAVTPSISVRAQEELVLTRYAGISQRNNAFYVGVALKL